MNAQCQVVFVTLISSAWTRRIRTLASISTPELFCTCAEAVLNTRSRKMQHVVLVSLFTFLVNSAELTSVRSLSL